MDNANCLPEKIPQLTNNDNTISITIFDKDDIKIPIEYYSVDPDLIINLELEKKIISIDGINQKTTSDVKKKWTLSRQVNKVNNLFVYSRILTKRDLPGIGIYTGNIAEFGLPTSNYKPEEDINQPISFRPVYINIEPSPLNRITSFKHCDNLKNLTIADMIEQIYTTLMVKPIGGVEQINGTYRATYDISCKQETLTFRMADKEKGASALPMGSRFVLIDQESGQIVKGFSQIILHQTNDKGWDAITGQDITGDNLPASFIHLYNIPTGRYLYFAEYTSKSGKAKQTPFQELIIQS